MQIVLNIPHFAPLYKFKDVEYYSPIEIVKQKGFLKLNRNASRIIDHIDFLFCPPGIMIDSDIKRIVYKWETRNVINDQMFFIRELAKAMINDARKIEENYPEHTLILLVGGRDSQNMLLLPWKNPVIVASADPNYPLVKEFMEKCSLKYDLIKLSDDLDINIEKEILINMCRLNLEHCRWTGHLDQLVKELEGKAVILKGQWGDVLLTTRWRRNRKPPSEFHYQYYSNKLERKARKLLKNFEYSVFHEKKGKKLFFKNLWYEAAHWQGVHMSFLHEYIGCPVISIYHNENVIKVISQTNYERVITEDLRSQIGKELFNNIVPYPNNNPSPPLSKKRSGLSGTRYFLKELKKLNIPVQY